MRENLLQGLRDLQHLWLIGKYKVSDENGKTMMSWLTEKRATECLRYYPKGKVEKMGVKK